MRIGGSHLASVIRRAASLKLISSLWGTNAPVTYGGRHSASLKAVAMAARIAGAQRLWFSSFRFQLHSKEASFADIDTSQGSFG